ncbi:GvpL/GvpF family gas vesicle protein [Metabacillus arenae]|uniref:GvpL/GvpF family gas vesicle protein n=1 Tax=Metabacillus arenae TaxID=2771434 RepID=A0A926NF90_9BACI|nr:GvpL/GvpF family gas vesicle protein [Metabacillus arenae]MBD1380171.1 GvpL/GvpF family gas vesicle protein [Metabacillus arenae]
MRKLSKSGIYIFCGIQTTMKKDLDFGSIDLGGEKRDTFTIHYEDAAIVAAEVPMKIYHPNKQNIMAHQEVVSSVMKKNNTVIPISFGNVFNSKDDVKHLLRSLYPQFSQIFPEIKGKMELGLKVVAKDEWINQELSKRTDIQKQRQTVNNKSENAGYYDRIKLGGMAQNFFEILKKDIQKEVYQPLKSCAEASKSNEPIGEKMLLNASFLVDNEKEELFDVKVNEIHEHWKGKVDFHYTGPWPAYNFINIQLKVEKSS